MSLDIRYLTNGEKSVYAVRNSGVTPTSLEIFETYEDIDERIRHYAPKGEPKWCGPDLARTFGVLDLFYPNHPNCVMKNYSDRQCIAESCKYNRGLPKYECLSKTKPFCFAMWTFISGLYYLIRRPFRKIRRRILYGN